LDTANLVIGITNLRFKVYTYTSTSYDNFDFSPVGLDGIKINFAF